MKADVLYTHGRLYGAWAFTAWAFHHAPLCGGPGFGMEVMRHCGGRWHRVWDGDQDVDLGVSQPLARIIRNLWGGLPGTGR